ncbi:MAG TPA: pyrroline-5-carboxylate reductase [Bryobacterales bacterium]|nr:pyrroline-5-carboxylate reductase [Bryobacterales bacterium]
MLQDKQIAVLGAGRLGEALIRGLLDKDVSRARLRATVAGAKRAEYLRQRYAIDVAAGSNADAASGADIVIIAVKPAKVASVLREIQTAPRPAQVIVSLAAAVRLRLMEAQLPASTPVVRAMPNIAMALGQSATALCPNAAVTDDQRALVASLFRLVGEVEFVEEEAIDGVTALAGSGPAFIFYLLEALAEGGRRAGVPDEVAGRLARQTLLGAARLALETTLSPGEWIEQVKTPGGTTVAGLAVLQREGVREALIEAVEAAARRATEIGAEFET